MCLEKVFNRLCSKFWKARLSTYHRKAAVSIPEQKMIKVNTDNILFICGGAFDGLEKHIARRMNTQVIGYNNKAEQRIDKESMFQYVSHQDLKNFGLIPELIGRSAGTDTP